MTEKSYDELLYLYRTGNRDAFLQLFERIVVYCKAKAGSVSRVLVDEHDREEIVYALVLIVYNAIDRYRDDLHKSFPSYVYMILKYRFCTVMKNMQKMKYSYENTISLDQLIDLEGEDTFEMIIADPSIEYRPYEKMNDEYEVNKLTGLIDECMTILEKNALMLSAQNYSNGEIAEMMGKEKKQISNAKERGKVKLDHILKENNQCFK